MSFYCPDAVIQAGYPLYRMLGDAVGDKEKSFTTQNMEQAYGQWVNAVRRDLGLPPRTDKRVSDAAASV